MKSLNTDYLDFADGFVEYCYNKGFTEEQTAALLKKAAMNELAESADPYFQEGLQLGLTPKYEKLAAVKQAFNPLKMFRLGKGLPPPPTAGATAAAGKAPWEFTIKIPRDGAGGGLANAATAGVGAAGGAVFGDPENSTLQNTLIGAGTGIGARMATGAMFKGKNFSNFMSGINPFYSIPASARGAGGVPSGTFGLNLLKPVETLGKTLFHKDTGKALRSGGLYGGLGGAAYAASPGASNQQETPSSLRAPAAPRKPVSPDQSALFSMPGSLKETYQSGKLTPASALANKSKIDREIDAVSLQLKTLNDTSPNSILQSVKLKTQLARLQHERNKSQKMLESLTNEINTQTEAYAAGQDSPWQNFLNTINPANFMRGGLENRINSLAAEAEQYKS